MRVRGIVRVVVDVGIEAVPVAACEAGHMILGQRAPPSHSIKIEMVWHERGRVRDLDSRMAKEGMGEAFSRRSIAAQAKYVTKNVPEARLPKNAQDL